MLHRRHPTQCDHTPRPEPSYHPTDLPSRGLVVLAFQGHGETLSDVEDGVGTDDDLVVERVVEEDVEEAGELEDEEDVYRSREEGQGGGEVS